MSLKNIFKINNQVHTEKNSYNILKRLGNGGSGDAYLVICTKGINSGCYFVIKFFYQIDMPDRLARFNNEIKFLKEANHPSIVKLVDDGIHKYKEFDLPFYVMEYMPNNLKHELCNGKLTKEKAFSYTTQLLSALKYLKDKNVIHRDIKPENIFINGPRAILGDFGLIKHISDVSATTSDIEDIEGSIFSDISNGCAMPLQYRSPHLLKYLTEGKQLSYDSDTFQLGLVITNMFTGYHPLKHSKTKSDPVEFAKPLRSYFEDILKTYKGDYIYMTVSNMLKLNDIDNIWPIEKVLTQFSNTFIYYLKEKDKLDGEIFI